MRLFLALTAAGLVAGCTSAPSGPVTESGELATGDRTLTQGEFIDSYTVQMREGQWIKVDLRSTVFDPYLILRTPGGQSSDNDDANGDPQHSQIVYRATEAGQFEIGVTSFASAETGAYTLVYEVTDTQPQAVATDSETSGSGPADPSTSDVPEAEPDSAGQVKI